MKFEFKFVFVFGRFLRAHAFGPIAELGAAIVMEQMVFYQSEFRVYVILVDSRRVETGGHYEILYYDLYDVL